MLIVAIGMLVLAVLTGIWGLSGIAVAVPFSSKYLLITALILLVVALGIFIAEVIKLKTAKASKRVEHKKSS